MEIVNKTELDSKKIVSMILKATNSWQTPRLKVTIRYSRGAKYSGTYIANPPRIYVNIAKNNRYPMKLETSIAKAQTIGRYWWKPIYHIRLENPYQLVLFVFMHEFYHYLIHRARKNSHRKEAMCDRFAIKYLVENYKLKVYDSKNTPVEKEKWLFQDLEGFVRNARTDNTIKQIAATRPRK